MKLEEKRLNTITRYEGVIVRLRLDNALLPDGSVALREAIERDDKYFEDAAIENGTTTAQEREKWRTHLENEQLRAKVQQYDEMLQDQQKKAQADRQYSSWVQEGEQLKQIYPSFDLRTESKNPEFGQLLASGVSVKTAYEVIHKDELISGAMQFASREAEKRVANAVIAGQRRPTEGAASNRAPSLRKTDVSQLTRADREEIDRRVARGEKIRF